MKVYISADIEGVTGIAHWDEATRSKSDYPPFAAEMNREVQAACEGANLVGIEEIWIKDAHGIGRNLSFSGLPKNVKLIRAFNGHPFGMMQELDNTFDAVIMVGYHSMAGSDQNPLAHTLDDEKIDWIKINGLGASEFLINAYTAAYVGVPVVLVSGDAGLCHHVQQINENIRTIAVSQGVGKTVIGIHPDLVFENIKEETKLALEGNLDDCLIQLPPYFTVEINFCHPYQAYRASFYPGMKKVSEKRIVFETEDYFEVLRMLSFVI